MCNTETLLATEVATDVGPDVTPCLGFSNIASITGLLSLRSVAHVLLPLPSLPPTILSTSNLVVKFSLAV